MNATEELLRTIKLDESKIQYMDVTLVSGGRGLQLTINRRPGYPAVRARQICKEFVRWSTPKTDEDIRALGRWLDGADQ